MSNKKAPNEIYEKIKETYDERFKLLTGAADGKDYRFKPSDVLAKPSDANEAAQAVLNEALNTEQINIGKAITDYRTANGICGFARDNLVSSTSRIEGVRSYVNNLVTDTDGKRMEAAIPGYPVKDE